MTSTAEPSRVAEPSAAAEASAKAAALAKSARGGPLAAEVYEDELPAYMGMAQGGVALDERPGTSYEYLAILSLCQDQEEEQNK